MVTLVTGATGLLGNNAVRLLLESGRSVRVLTRLEANPRPLDGLAVEVAHGDVRDKDAVAKAVEGASEVVHAAGYVHIGWTGSQQAQAVNVEGTRNVVEAARDAGARMVHVSSLDALGNTTATQPGNEDTAPDGGVLCPYVVSKRQAEQVVLEGVAQGLDARIVNPGYLIGPYDWKPSSGRMLLQVAKSRGIWAPLGANQFCDVRDVACGVLAALERGTTGRRYILGGQWLSYFQAWRIFAHVTGSLPPVFPAGPLIRTGAGFCGDVWTRISGREGDVNSAATAMSGQSRNFSDARARNELNYQPHSLLVAATDAWTWFRANGYA